ncbi:MAG: N-formylglutamate amidohydrolase [Pseudomonadota bacterium]
MMTGAVVEKERQTIARYFSPGFSVHDGAAMASPFVFCSPHSGRVYPPAFLEASRLDAVAIRKSEDSFVDDLFRPVGALGAPLIAAQFPRAYLDLNREPYELDPLLFRDALPSYANTRSVRVMSGLGTVARIVADNEPIYRGALPVAVAYERIERLYRPFHRALAALLEDRRRHFGAAVLVDCHSMPSQTAAPTERSTFRDDGRRADIILGDRFGIACTAALTCAMKDALQRQGFDVALNRPYAGGYITEHYGRPAHHVEAIQIEVNRALYMNEHRYTRTNAFDAVQARLTAALDEVIHARGAPNFAQAAE